jgi:hypothetical protein
MAKTTNSEAGGEIKRLNPLLLEGILNSTDRRDREGQ